MRITTRPGTCISAHIGRFTVKAAKSNVLSTNRQTFLWTKYIWHAWMPTNIGSFICKLVYSVTPMDENIQNFFFVTIAFESRCRISASNKTLDHLFTTSQLARSLWDYFNPRFWHLYPSTLRNVIASLWMMGAHMHSYFGFFRVVHSCVLFWETWLSIEKKFSMVVPP